MPINKARNKRRLSPWQGLPIIILVGLLVILMWYALRFQYLEKKPLNVDIAIFDNSIGKENPSIIIKIDDQEIYSLDSISKSIKDDFQFHLSPGKHSLKISAFSGLYPYADSILIKNNKTYTLWVRFKYNPPIEEYGNIMVKELYERKINNASYTSEQKSKLLLRIKELIDKDLEEQSWYEPSNRYFEATLMEGPFRIE